MRIIINNMKNLILLICITFFLNDAIAQTKLKKELIFFEDSLRISWCGGILETSVLYFVSDTSATRTRSSEYFILTICPELYGNDFFQKGKKYLLELNKNYTEAKRYMPISTFKLYYKTRRLFVLKRIKKLS